MDDKRYQRLKKALEKGTISIGFYDRALLRPGSPAFSWPDILIPSTLMFLALILDFAFAPLIVALLSLGAAVAIILLGFLRWVRRRARKRAWKLALSNLENWESLWATGGVSIWLARRIGIGCDSPDGDWKEFIRQQVDKANPSMGASPSPSDFRRALETNEALNAGETIKINKHKNDSRDNSEESARRRRSG
tara:strand:- start:96 stop:674 length:579 start_codon:yes stop_codon:yes gene_type:complete